MEDESNQALPRKTHIIGFHGKQKAGKSLAADYLCEQKKYQRGKFAQALKDMLRTYLRYRGADSTLIERMIEGDLKEIESPLLCGKTPRHAMQTLGTEWGRKYISADMWVETEMEAKKDCNLLVFDDVRFENEANAIRKAGGTIIHILREPENAEIAATPSQTKEKTIIQQKMMPSRACKRANVVLTKARGTKRKVVRQHESETQTEKLGKMDTLLNNATKEFFLAKIDALSSVVNMPSL